LQPVRRREKEGEKKVNNLLLDDKPLVILPSLAEKLGLNEAIFIQQLHYWLKDSNNIRDGLKWVYNTYEDWNEQFPFWSIRTLKRVITGLENNGFIITANYNQMKIDKTKWYRIDYEKLNELVARPSCQNGTSKVTDCPIEGDKLASPLPEITTEITTEKKEVEEAPSCEVNPFSFFEENGFGTIGGYMAEKIGQWCDDLSPELVLEAMKIAVEYGVKNWTYVERILGNWAEKKFKTLDQVHAALLAFKEKQSRQRDRPKNYKPKRMEMLPDWFNEDPLQQVSKKNNSDAELETTKKEIEEKLKILRGKD
jgi:DnaD/phage-associated family protein